jgi:PAS domain S-box-containing protein
VLGLSAEPVLDASPNPVIAIDGRGRIAYASPRVLETFGWPPEDLLGEQVERLLPARFVERHVARPGAKAGACHTEGDGRH